MSFGFSRGLPRGGAEPCGGRDGKGGREAGGGHPEQSVEEMSLPTASKPRLPLPSSWQRAAVFWERPCPAADL